MTAYAHCPNCGGEVPDFDGFGVLPQQAAAAISALLQVRERAA